MRFSHRAGLLARLAGLALLGVPAAAQAQEGGSEHRGAAALGLALRRLETTKRVLMIGAHPDDENNPVLAALALGEGADVAYLSLTRGEGGQNVIGPELQEGLGIIRSEELLAARRLDGARQFFARAYDYGFSKSAEEAFRHWPRDSLLADVVEVIRRYRPDVILSVWSGTPRDGHGQHQATGMVARDAYEAAADPARFPAQIAAGLSPHRAKRLVQSVWRGAPAGAVTIETGTFDPLFGRSHYQIAMAGRSRHRSQDQGSAEPAGAQRTAIVPLAGDTSMRGALFGGIDTTLAAAARRASAGPVLAAAVAGFEGEVAAAVSAFNPVRPDGTAPRLAAALRSLRRADSIAAVGGTGEALRFRIRAELRETGRALRLAAAIELLASSDEARVVPGETFTLTLRLWNGGRVARRLTSLEPDLPPGWSAVARDSMPGAIAPGAVAIRRFSVRAPETAADAEPWYLRLPRDGDLYRWPADPSVRTLPFEPDPVRAVARLEIEEVPLALAEDAAYIEVDRVLGERRLPVLLVPAVSVAVEPRVAVVPLGAAAGPAGRRTARELTVVLTGESAAPVEGTVRLEAPAGWRVEPASVRARLDGPGSRVAMPFNVEPPEGLPAGRSEVKALFVDDRGARYDRAYDVIEYPHTRPRLRFEPATAVFSAFAVAVAPELRVGYVEGAGDAGPEALAQLGVRVDRLDAAMLLNGDLGRYAAILVGIRAYEVRPDLEEANSRLLEYVNGGGTLIVQYNRQGWATGGFTPMPVTMAQSAGRVTDEDSPVRLLAPDHPLLSAPNRIGASDFQGWAQERGLYFLDTWDDRYTPLLELTDPGETGQRGSLVAASWGRGRYAYVALSLFRQLPQGVPGAYRLLANLVSWGG